MTSHGTRESHLLAGYHTLSEYCVSLCQSFREQKFTRNFSAISSNYTDSSHPSFSMKLIHRASSIFAAGLMTSPLHHGAAAAVISYRADNWWNFLPGSKDVAKPPDIVLSLSLSCSLSVCLKNCQEIASYSNFSKASLHADPVIEMAFHADALPCSMEVISWDLPEGFCSLINCFTKYSWRLESSRKGCRQGVFLFTCVNISLRSKLFRTFFIPEKEKTWNFPLTMYIKGLALRAAFIIGRIALSAN